MERECGVEEVPMRVKMRRPRAYDYVTILADGGESQPLPTWKTYLWRLQEEAPKPRRIACQHEIPNKPPFYGKEYHGNISREETEELLSGGDGCYLVRKSERAPDAYTLVIRFNGETKNFKLFFDGKHYVGEKRFDTVHSLVEDGLIHFYIEHHASDYINSLSNSKNYEESPYMAYSKRRRQEKSIYKSLSRNRVDHSDGEATLDRGIPQTVEEEEQEPEDLPDTEAFEKSHQFKVTNFVGLHWCDFCANFMWGLIAQGVKCQDCGFEAHKKCSEKVPNDCMPEMKFVKRVYGADLTTVVKAQKTAVPIVVINCIREIEARGMDAEGLYRIAGYHDHVEAVRMAFDKDMENADISAEKYDDINTVTSALKLYFRLLPIPLITFDVYQRLIDLIRKEGTLQPAEKLRQFKEELNSLPPAHYQTLKYLGSHLTRVMEKKQVKMGAENLSIVFAPTLMRPMETDPMVSLAVANLEQKIMEFILVHFREIFSRGSRSSTKSYYSTRSSVAC